MLRIATWATLLSFAALTSHCAYNELGFNEGLNAERAAEKQQAHDQAVANAKPRMVSQDGGCEVWSFLPHGGKRWLYFSRCEAKTTTFNQWEECRTVSQGKTSRQECTEHQLEVTQESVRSVR